MADCAVCRYWYERLEATRTHHNGKSALEQHRRVMAALRTHQFGACARRFPDLLRDLVKQELVPPDKARGVVDPARAAILVNSLTDDFGGMPTYEWRQ